MPDGYTISPHWQSTIENVTVLIPDKLDKSKGLPLTSGSFFSGPAQSHFAWATGETVVAVTGMGPLDFKYVIRRMIRPRRQGAFPMEGLDVSATGQTDGRNVVTISAQLGGYPQLHDMSLLDPQPFVPTFLREGRGLFCAAHHCRLPFGKRASTGPGVA